MGKIIFGSDGESQIFTTKDGDEIFFRESDKIYVAFADTGEAYGSKTSEYLTFNDIEEAQDFLNKILENI